MLLIMQFSPASSPSSQVGPNIPLEHPQSCNVSDKILHTYKTPDKNAYVCVLMFTCFDSRQELCQTQEEIQSRLKSGNAWIIRCRIFCLPVCYPKIWRLRYTEL
jgi:hypothetical protein